MQALNAGSVEILTAYFIFLATALSVMKNRLKAEPETSM